ncbi:hypothetical protein ZHAS_00021829 [Anopheles sinensis]|uniref:Uncharacterized protein n=1 Tax=Anopheles sinensis TaxID=74873 RepID=A0A084WTP7_ANOSI|nr:hypothetical protein ZHAS_00021829 [Anopheles sinensis]
MLAPGTVPHMKRLTRAELDSHEPFRKIEKTGTTDDLVRPFDSPDVSEGVKSVALLPPGGPGKVELKTVRWLQCMPTATQLAEQWQKGPLGQDGW